MRRIDELQMSKQEQLLDGVVSVREVLAYLEEDRYLNLTGASKYLNMSKSTIRHRDDIPKYSINKKLLLFKKSELDAWLVQYRKGEWWELRELVVGVVEDVTGD